jgi:hypothetical protein
MVLLPTGQVYKFQTLLPFVHDTHSIFCGVQWQKKITGRRSDFFLCQTRLIMYLYSHNGWSIIPTITTEFTDLSVKIFFLLKKTHPSLPKDPNSSLQTSGKQINKLRMTGYYCTVITTRQPLQNFAKRTPLTVNRLALALTHHILWPYTIRFISFFSCPRLAWCSKNSEIYFRFHARIAKPHISNTTLIPQIHASRNFYATLIDVFWFLPTKISVA